MHAKSNLHNVRREAVSDKIHERVRRRDVPLLYSLLPDVVLRGPHARLDGRDQHDTEDDGGDRRAHVVGHGAAAHLTAQAEKGEKGSMKMLR